MKKTAMVMIVLVLSGHPYGESPSAADSTLDTGAAASYKALPLFPTPESKKLAADIAAKRIDPLALIRAISPYALTPPGAVYDAPCSIKRSTQFKELGLPSVDAVFTFDQARTEKAYQQAHDFYKKSGFRLLDQGMFADIRHPKEDRNQNDGRRLGIGLFVTKLAGFSDCTHLPPGPALTMTIAAPRPEQ